MNMFRKVIGVLIVFLLLQVSVVIMQSHAADEDIFKGVDISKNGNGSVMATLSQDQTTLTISGTGEMKDWSNTWTIPWYSYSGKITTVKINQGVTSIGTDAFYGCSSLSSIELPNSVTSIGERTFSYCNSLTSINIPNSVTSIGSDVFRACSSLSSIEIPSSVASIGKDVFHSCNSLTSIIVDSNNTKYTSEDGVLFDKEKTNIIKYPAKKEIKIYSIPKSVTRIWQSAFYGCNSLSSIEIPSSVTTIERDVFYSCSSLTSIIVDSNNTKYTSEDGVLFNKDKTIIMQYPAKKEGEIYKILSSVTKIEDFAFYECSSLKSIELSTSVMSIGNRAFSKCSSLSSIKIPSSVTSIGESAFYECSSLKSIEIPSGVTSIGDSAFRSCSSLSSIKIPSSVTKIEDSVFCECSSLSNIELPSSITSIGSNVFSECSSLSSIELPSTVTSIKFNTFYKCISLSSIKLPSSVTSIETQAFCGCSSLRSIELSSSITSIGDKAFKDCSSLSSINIPSSVTSIGSYAFSKCSSLSSIEIPSNVASIGDSAFERCNLLIKTSEEEITIPNILKRAMTENDILYTTKEVTLTNCEFNENKDKIKISKANSSEISIKINDGALKEFRVIIVPLEKMDISKKNDGSVIAQISDDLTILTISGTGDMKNWDNEKTPWSNWPIVTVKINQGVTNIGGSAFYSCSSLSSIELPSSLTSITNNAFKYCRSLSNIKIPSSVTSIGGSAFYECSSLKSIELPSGVASIEGSAFLYCSSLSSITVDSNNTKYTSEDGVLFDKEKTNIIKYPEKKEGDSYKIPSSVTSIGEEAFSSCSSLRSIEIPSSVTSIGDRAFYRCRSLSSIEIPSGVTSIGSIAFDGCSSLSSIIIPKEVTSIGRGVFNSCSNLTITCKGGTTAETYAKDNNIKYVLDNEVKIKGINYSTKELTNQNVTVTITGEEESRQINGWNLSEDRKTLTKTYKANTEDEITILDLVGNERTEKITINNIVTEAETTLEVNTYTVENNTINNIQPSMSYTDFIKNITSNKEIVVKEGNTTVTGTNKIKTGEVLTTGEKTYTLVVTGDTNGDGQADIKDILQINKHRLNKAQLTSVYYTAGDVNKDGKVDIKDILQLNKYRLGKISSL